MPAAGLPSRWPSSLSQIELVVGALVLGWLARWLADRMNHQKLMVLGCIEAKFCKYLCEYLIAKIGINTGESGPFKR